MFEYVVGIAKMMALASVVFKSPLAETE